jgi:hypothetical protein
MSVLQASALIQSAVLKARMRVMMSVRRLMGMLIIAALADTNIQTHLIIAAISNVYIAMKMPGMVFVHKEYSAKISAGISNPINLIAVDAITNVPPPGVQQVNAAFPARFLVMTSVSIRIGI